jgi:hypothetical protein
LLNAEKFANIMSGSRVQIRERVAKVEEVFPGERPNRLAIKIASINHVTAVFQTDKVADTELDSQQSSGEIASQGIEG